MKKITIAIVGAIIISLFATFIIVVNNAQKKAVLSPIDDNVVYQNAYISKCDAGKIRFVCQGKEYEVSGIPAETIADVADIVVENGKVSLIRDKENLTTGRLLSYGDDYFEVENYGVVQRNKELPIYKITSYGVVEGNVNDLVVGADSFEYVCENGVICALVQKNPTNFDTIRVLILNHDQIYYDNIWIKSEGNLLINDQQIEDKEISVLNCMNDREKNELKISTSQNKLYFSKDGENYLKNGYEGNFIVKRNEHGLYLINELFMEDYIRYVLPSEMPVSFSYEALKAQAVCARTFAYSQMKNSTYSNLGANLDDSTAYQVYNYQGNYEITDKAVRDTEGKVITQDNNLITCYYFSTCSGMTEDMEVWVSPTPGYIKKVESKDESSIFYKWSTKLDLSSYNDSDLGKLNNVSIISKSDSGYVLELELDYEKGKRTYNTELDIRKVMGNIVTAISLNDGSIRDDLSMLPSACFTIADDGVNVYGGGFGHGIGMSQYGANELATEGNDYNQIINYYYNNIEVKDIAETAY